VVTPVGASVTACLDAELFERTVFLAAGGVTPDRPGVLHPRGSERVPGLHLYVAFAGARAVGTALAVVHSRGVHVSAVAVLPEERGRGIGAALAATALNTQPCMPATLTASFLSAPIYRRLGFEPVGEPLDWKPVANLSPAEKDVSHT
jgi:GNAT superfamily N-acetyltransferase